MPHGIVLSGDWQAQFSNLDTLETYIDWLVSLGRPDRDLIITGDLKEKLNPNDGRVLKRLQNMLYRLRAVYASVTIVKGNHDQFSVSMESENFLSLIAPPESFLVVEEPEIVRLGGRLVACLPYGTTDAMREALSSFAADLPGMSKPGHPWPVLVFHAGIQSARLNALQVDESSESLTLGDLHPEIYSACFGGHYHYRQQVGTNAWYVGSPFCHSWGEASQIKGAVLYEGGKVQLLDGPIPGWYDPSLPGFEEPATWAGARVRVRVSVNPGSMEIPSLLRAAEAEANAKYSGAEIVVEKRVEEGLSAALTGLGSDQDIVGEWTAQLPAEAQDWALMLENYLLSRLERVATLTRTGAGVRFLEFEGENILSFEKIRIDYRRPAGLRLITATNEDWGNRSNGSGKTSYMQMLPIVMAGKSLKGQKADKWRRRGSTGRSYGRLKMELPNGSVVEVERQRHPKQYVRLYVNGKDETSGMGDADVIKTLENLTGLTWSMITSAIYVDQGGVNRLLSGTDSERKQIVADFLNLERYAKAQEVIKFERERLQTLRADMGESFQLEEANLRKLESFLLTLESMRAEETAKHEETLTTAEREAVAVASSLGEANRHLAEARANLRNAENAAAENSRALMKLNFEGESLLKSVKAAERAAEAGKCPTCGAETEGNTAGLADVDKHQKRIKAIERERAPLQVKDKSLREAVTACNLAESQIVDEVQGFSREAAVLRNRIDTAKREVDRLKAVGENEERTRTQIREAKRRVRIFKDAEGAVAEDLKFLGHGIRAFGKDGIPALISARLCPRLNQFAEYYSDLFTGGQIRVSFDMKKDDIEISIGNATGGAGLLDQSGGETRMASLVVAFSLRELISGCNVLMLDEPGEGLDETGMRAFVSGLARMADHYDTIMLCTHSPYAKDELQGYPEIRIAKSGGVSSVIS